MFKNVYFRFERVLNKLLARQQTPITMNEIKINDELKPIKKSVKEITRLL